MKWLFEFAEAKRVDPERILTHRFPLERYKDAFMTCYRQGDHRAVKVVFDEFQAGACTAVSRPFGCQSRGRSSGR